MDSLKNPNFKQKKEKRMLNQNTKTKREIAIISIAAMIIVTSLVMIVSMIHGNSTTSISLVSKNYLEANEEKTGKVIVSYLDTFGNEIADSTEVSGKLGDEYSVEAKKIESYILHTNPFNRKGNFDVSEQNVDFVYEKDTTTVDENSDGQNVVVTIYKNKDVKVDDYKLIIKTVDEDGNAVTGTAYKTVNANSAVVRSSTDYTGNFVVGCITLDGVATEKYTTTELKCVEGYVALDGAIKLTVNKTQDGDAYKLDASIEEKENVSLNVDHQNKEVVITVVKKLVPAPNPPETGEKIFDLTIDKKIKTVRVKNSAEDKTITKTNKDELVKVDLPKSKLAETELTVTYEIVVKNVGEVAGYATSVVDDFPTGMKLAGEDVDWTENDTHAISTKFASTLLNPGDSISQEIVLKIKLTEGDVGTKTNKANISTYYNDEGLKDNTPDNNTEEPLLITVKTGYDVLIPVSAVMLIMAATVIVYVVKKRNTNE